MPYPCTDTTSRSRPTLRVWVGIPLRNYSTLGAWIWGHWATFWVCITVRRFTQVGFQLRYWLHCQWLFHPLSLSFRYSVAQIKNLKHRIGTEKVLLIKPQTSYQICSMNKFLFSLRKLWASVLTTNQFIYFFLYVFGPMRLKNLLGI